MSNSKKEFAPSVKLYPSKSGKTFTAYITEKSSEHVGKVFSRVELGGMIILKPVNENYRRKAMEDGGAAPDFEIVIQTKAEVDAFRASIKAEDTSDSL